MLAGIKGSCRMHRIWIGGAGVRPCTLQPPKVANGDFWRLQDASMRDGSWVGCDCYSRTGRDACGSIGN